MAHSLHSLHSMNTHRVIVTMTLNGKTKRAEWSVAAQDNRQAIEVALDNCGNTYSPEHCRAIANIEVIAL